MSGSASRRASACRARTPHPPDLVEQGITLVIDGELQPARSWIVRPPAAISWRAKKIHGITEEDVADAPPVAEIQGEVLSALTGVDIVVGHQVHVDLDVMTRSFPAWRPPPAVDTLRLARAQYPHLSSHKLGDVAHALDLTGPGGPAHRAGHDTTVIARLLIHLVHPPDPCHGGGSPASGWLPAQPARTDQTALDFTT